MSDSKRLDVSLDPNDYEDVEINDPDNPEWTDEDFARARPIKEVLPDLYEQIVREGVTTTPLSPSRKAS